MSKRVPSLRVVARGEGNVLPGLKFRACMEGYQIYATDSQTLRLDY
jgi:hypothetical protein